MELSLMDQSAPPPKRQRLSPAGDEDEHYDAKRLSELRRSNTLLLKSRLEGIFLKYSHNFEDQSDVIDLREGVIVEDNGHLDSMRNEFDSGRSNDRRPKDHRIDGRVSTGLQQGPASKSNIPNKAVQHQSSPAHQKHAKRSKTEKVAKDKKSATDPAEDLDPTASFIDSVVEPLSHSGNTGWLEKLSDMVTDRITQQLTTSGLLDGSYTDQLWKAPRLPVPSRFDTHADAESVEDDSGDASQDDDEWQSSRRMLIPDSEDSSTSIEQHDEAPLDDAEYKDDGYSSAEPNEPPESGLVSAPDLSLWRQSKHKFTAKRNRATTIKRPRWTEDEIRDMVAMKEKGYTNREIATHFGRTERSCYQQFYVLRWSRNPLLSENQEVKDEKPEDATPSSATKGAALTTGTNSKLPAGPKNHRRSLKALKALRAQVDSVELTSSEIVAAAKPDEHERPSSVPDFNAAEEFQVVSPPEAPDPEEPQAIPIHTTPQVTSTVEQDITMVLDPRLFNAGVVTDETKQAVPDTEQQEECPVIEAEVAPPEPAPVQLEERQELNPPVEVSPAKTEEPAIKKNEGPQTKAKPVHKARATPEKPRLSELAEITPVQSEEPAIGEYEGQKPKKKPARKPRVSSGEKQKLSEPAESQPMQNEELVATIDEGRKPKMKIARKPRTSLGKQAHESHNENTSKQENESSQKASRKPSRKRKRNLVVVLKIPGSRLEAFVDRSGPVSRILDAKANKKRRKSAHPVLQTTKPSSITSNAGPSLIDVLKVPSEKLEKVSDEHGPLKQSLGQDNAKASKKRRKSAFPILQTTESRPTAHQRCSSEIDESSADELL